MRTVSKQIFSSGNWILTVAMLFLHPTDAIAGPPFITDDPEPVQLHHWEIYMATQTAIARDGTSGTAPHFEINYGAFPEVQLHLITPFVYDNPRGSSNSHYGCGDTEFGIKYRFIQETNEMPQIGTFPITEIPTGSQDQGLGNGKQQLFLPLWAQKSWGKWTTYGGAGAVNWDKSDMASRSSIAAICLTAFSKPSLPNC